MLKGKMIVLRPVKKTDVVSFLKWFNDQEVTRYLTRYLPLTEMEEEEWIGNLAKRKNDVMFAIEEIEDKKLIGSCGFHMISYKDQNAVMGMVIGDKEYWNKGYGTEATELLIEYGFNQLNLHHLSSSVFKPNKGSIRIHEKNGFQKEGCRREAFFRNGEFCDEIIFGLLRREWKGSK